MYPPNVNKLIDELGSSLKYENGYALNFEHASESLRKADNPFFTVVEKKCHDIFEVLIDVTNDKIKKEIRIAFKSYNDSFSLCGEFSRPILSLMMWGPQSNNNLPCQI